MAPARGDRHRERRAPALVARHRDGATVQLRELLHQGEPDPSPLVRPRPRALHAMEALEQARQLPGRNAGAAVAHGQNQPAPIRRDAQRDGHLAFERVLEGVGEEIEDHLFPHLPVHARLHAIRQRRRVHDESQSSPLHRGAE